MNIYYLDNEVFTCCSILEKWYVLNHKKLNHINKIAEDKDDVHMLQSINVVKELYSDFLDHPNTSYDTEHAPYYDSHLLDKSPFLRHFIEASNRKEQEAQISRHNAISIEAI